MSKQRVQAKAVPLNRESNSLPAMGSIEKSGHDDLQNIGIVIPAVPREAQLHNLAV
jgi:hypothetical protein